MTKEPTDDPCIPTEYKNAYVHYLFHALCQNAITFLQVVAKKQGGNLFNLKEVMGDCMLELQDCDDILNLLVDEYCNQNMAMRKEWQHKLNFLQFKLQNVSKYRNQIITKNCRRKIKVYCGYDKNATLTFIEFGRIPVDPASISVAVIALGSVSWSRILMDVNQKLVAAESLLLS